MPRNLERRVEILFPLETPRIVESLKHILKVQLEDNTKARLMRSDGTYERLSPGRSTPVCAQEVYMKEALAFAAEREKAVNERVFVAEEKK